MKQSGFITIPLSTWLIVAACLAAAGGIAYGKYQSKRAEAAEANLAAFRANVEAAGKVAQIAAKQKERENADKVTAAITSRDAAIRRLRESANSAKNSLSRNAETASATGQGCVRAQVIGPAMAEFREVLERSMAQAGRNSIEGDIASVDATACLEAWPK